ncbi:urease accessory protein UreD [Roseibium sp. RKSG952]|uniref:urease accessory protein UreD n=1 Tax=Roseibium sp. RKSG952 TaxID=2529384 RepID=UPI0012BD5107|nr:urease accessory protein UreD [Roseibium sp. RKSG952]MTI01059.1 urease accessory protein [Roseibium sp. RKSG952]
MYQAGNASISFAKPPRLQRTRAHARVVFKNVNGRAALDELYQSGSAKIRLPRVYDQIPVGVIINTSGGVTGGDRLVYEARAREQTHAIVASQTAERAYRSPGGSGEIASRLTVEKGAFLEWLPQEAILFDHSSLTRTLSADLAEDARLLAIESVVIGRTAMRETVRQLSFADRWRIRRNGRLVFADDIRLNGDPARILKGTATASGAHCFATLLDCRPDAEDHLQSARSALQAATKDCKITAAASAWNDILVARFIAHDSRHLKSALMAFLERYRNRPLPRVWYC